MCRSRFDARVLRLRSTAAATEFPGLTRCDLAQGYLVSRPASVEELITILNDEGRLRYYQQTASSGAAGPQEIATAPKSA